MRFGSSTDQLSTDDWQEMLILKQFPLHGMNNILRQCPAAALDTMIRTFIADKILIQDAGDMRHC